MLLYLIMTMVNGAPMDNQSEACTIKKDIHIDGKMIDTFPVEGKMPLFQVIYSHGIKHYSRFDSSSQDQKQIETEQEN